MTGGDILLVGAGGHAAGVAEAAALCGWRIVAYVDRRPADWLARSGSPRHFETDADAIAEMKGKAAALIGLGGIDPAGLALRSALLETYCKSGFVCPAVIHPTAIVSRTAAVADGAIVLAGAVLQPYCSIGRGALINTRSTVEHHAAVDEGGHVAPGATILGAARVGRNAIVGAHAVVLPGAEVPADSLVPAASVFKGRRG